MFALSESRDLSQWFKASFFATLVCMILYTFFGLIFVRHHAQMISSQMQLLNLYDMVPLVSPDDKYLNAWTHQVGSALFFGSTLGVLNALIAMAVSFFPWFQKRFSSPDIVVYILMGSLFTFLSFSRELPVASVLFGFVCPFFFFLTWSFFIRRSKDGRINFKRWIIISVIVASPFAGLVGLGTASFEIIRDSMLQMPVARTWSDFYYDHTLLAAHVIKPIAAQEQKVIVVTDDIKRIGPMPHGTLWIHTTDPCSISGSSMIVSGAPLPCNSFVLRDDKPANISNRIIKEFSTAFDYNEKMRSGIGLFFYSGPLLVVPVLFMLWLALWLSGLYERSRIVTVLIILGYLAIFFTPFQTVLLKHRLMAQPNRIHEYILSEQETKRYLALMSFPEEFKASELIKLLHDPSERIRLNALFEIGQRKDRKYLNAIADALDDPQLNVRTRACLALGELGSREAFYLLDRVLLDEHSWYVRGYAYRAIGRIRPVSRSVTVSTEHVNTSD